MQIFLFHLCCLWTRLIIEVSEAIILLGLLWWSFGIFLSAPTPLRLLWVFIMFTLIFGRVFLFLIWFLFSRVLYLKIFEAIFLALIFLFFFCSLEELMLLYIFASLACSCFFYWLIYSLLFRIRTVSFLVVFSLFLRLSNIWICNLCYFYIDSLRILISSFFF